jgi:hypothetical protein
MFPQNPPPSRWGGSLKPMFPQNPVLATGMISGIFPRWFRRNPGTPTTNSIYKKVVGCPGSPRTSSFAFLYWRNDLEWRSNHEYTTLAGDGVNYMYSGSANIGSGTSGEWLKISLPSAIVISAFTIKGAPDRCLPRSFSVYGSNDDSTYTRLITVSNETGNFHNDPFKQGCLTNRSIMKNPYTKEKQTSWFWGNPDTLPLFYI